MVSTLKKQFIVLCSMIQLTSRAYLRPTSSSKQEEGALRPAHLSNIGYRRCYMLPAPCPAALPHHHHCRHRPTGSNSHDQRSPTHSGEFPATCEEVAAASCGKQLRHASRKFDQIAIIDPSRSMTTDRLSPITYHASHRPQ